MGKNGGNWSDPNFVFGFYEEPRDGMGPQGSFERELQPRQTKHHPFAKGQIINMSGSLADP